MSVLRKKEGQESPKEEVKREGSKKKGVRYKVASKEKRRNKSPAGVGNNKS